MKKNTWCLIIAGMLVLVVVLSGCEVIFPPTTYEPTSTKVRYDISYGYLVNCTGTGRYEITYVCNPPSVLVGTVTYDRLYDHEYETKTLVNNTFILWNVSGTEQQTYELGITAHVITNNYLVPDLNGEDAVTIQVLQEKYPAIERQYTQSQGNETICFINPTNPNITTIARTVVENAGTNNSFLLAQSLFSWLKKNIQYQTHPGEEGVRPAAITLQMGNGDCDDLSFLYISLCRAVDIPARFIRGYLLTVYENGTAITTAHAWTEVFVGGSMGINGWIPVECACCTTSIMTDIQQNFGVETAFHLRLFIDDGSNKSLAYSLSGISYVKYGSNRNIELQPFAEIQNYQELKAQNLVVTSENTRYYE